MIKMKTQSEISKKDIEINFSITKIDEIQSMAHTGADFPKLANELKKIGVKSYNFNAITGLRIYESIDGQILEASAPSETNPIVKNANKEKVLQALKIHQKGDLRLQSERQGIPCSTGGFVYGCRRQL